MILVDMSLVKQNTVCTQYWWSVAHFFILFILFVCVCVCVCFILFRSLRQMLQELVHPPAPPPPQPLPTHPSPSPPLTSLTLFSLVVVGLSVWASTLCKRACVCARARARGHVCVCAHARMLGRGSGWRRVAGGVVPSCTSCNLYSKLPWLCDLFDHHNWPNRFEFRSVGTLPRVRGHGMQPETAHGLFNVSKLSCCQRGSANHELCIVLTIINYSECIEASAAVRSYCVPLPNLLLHDLAVSILPVSHCVRQPVIAANLGARLWLVEQYSRFDWPAFNFLFAPVSAVFWLVGTETVSLVHR